MALKNIASLADFKTTTNEKVFKVTYSTGESSYFVANVERDDAVWDLSSGTNTGCVLDNSDAGKGSQLSVVHNMYDAKLTPFHGIAARRHKYPYTDTYDYQHIYQCMSDTTGSRSQMPFKSMVQAGNTIYAISKKSTYGHHYPSGQLYDWLARDNGYAFPPSNDIKTVLYDAAKVKTELSASVKEVIHGIQYNTLYEIPGNIPQDYSKGEVLGTTLKCKNQLDCTYSMNGRIKFSSDTNVYLANYARDYLEAGNCNDQVYLKYKDTLHYPSDGELSTIDSHSGTDIAHTFAKEPTEDPTEKSKERYSSDYRLPHVELLENINRGASPSNHKSSLYSLKLKTKFLDSSTLDPLIKNNIKLEIQNYIRQIVQRLAPANTQLFSVTVS